jgi:streptogramin lyase
MSILSGNRRLSAARSRVRCGLDTLESRLLLSASVFDYPSPAAGALGGSHITADAAGNLYTMSFGGGIVKLDPSTGTQTFIDLPNETGGPLDYADLVYGPDGNLWITESFDNFSATTPAESTFADVLKVSTSGTVLATYSIGSQFGFPYSPKVGADGRIYMVDLKSLEVDANNVPTYTSSILAMTTTGSVTDYGVSVTDAYPVDLAASSDGSVYVAITGTTIAPIVGDAYESESRLGVLTGGQVHIVSLADPALVVNPHDTFRSVAIAPDGAVWLPMYTIGDNGPTVDTGVNQIVKVTLDSGLNPTFTSYSIPGEDPHAVLEPGSIVAASDGSIYVPEFTGSYIDRVNTATNSVDRIALSGDANLATSPIQVGGTIYFVQAANNDFAKIDLPVIGSGLAFAGLSGQSFSGAVASLNTTLSAGAVGGLSATIDWGDSTTSTGTLVNNGNGTVTINGAHTYAAAGDYVTNVVVTGSGIDAVRVTGDATIVPGATFSAAGMPVPAHQEDKTFTAAVATFIGPAATYTASINWGNGVTTTGSVILVSGVYQVVGSINYAVQGNYNITVSISGGSNAAVVHTSVAISDTPLVVTAAAPVVLLGRIAIGITAYFTDDTDSAARNYNASINWGDNSSSSGVVVSLGSGQYTVLGLHVYRRGGNYSLTTTITTIHGEDTGATASGTIVLHV